MNGGKDAIARLLSNDDMTKFIDQIGFGEGAAAPSSLDASLTNQFIKAVDGYQYPAVNKLQIDWTCGLTECNGMTITEFGLFCNDNTMFARRLALSPIVKTNIISLEGTWTLTF